MLRKGAEEARNELPDLLDAAEKGRSTIITRHGRPCCGIGANGSLWCGCSPTVAPAAPRIRSRPMGEEQHRDDPEAA